MIVLLYVFKVIVIVNLDIHIRFYFYPYIGNISDINTKQCLNIDFIR
jgi:hypothetical protein